MESVSQATTLLLIVHTQKDCTHLIKQAQDKDMSFFITKKIEEASKIIDMVG